QQKLRRLERLDDFQCFVQLSVGPRPKGFWRVFDNEIRLDALTFDTFSLPRIPAGDWHSEDVSTGQFEISPSENLTGSSRANDSGEAILFCKAGDHLRCAVRVFVDKNHDSTVERLLAEPLSDQDH